MAEKAKMTNRLLKTIKPTKTLLDKVKVKVSW